VVVVRREVTGRFKESAGAEFKRFHTYLPSEDDSDLIAMLREKGSRSARSPSPPPGSA